MSTLIAEACRAGARQQPACRCLGLSLRTRQRWRSTAGITADARAAAGAARTPANRLDAATRAAILAVANRPEFAHQPPTRSSRPWPTKALTSPRPRAATGCGARQGSSPVAARPVLRPGSAPRRCRRPDPTRCGAGTSPMWPTR
ncbi:MAG: hypothetical protein IPN92_11315 [Chromatiaceae bacterium]|nr:hypothetical protein [Chromatiaceae bacterium]